MERGDLVATSSVVGRMTLIHLAVQNAQRLTRESGILRTE